MVEINIDENFELVISNSNPTTASSIWAISTYLRRLIERNEITKKTTFFEEVLSDSLYEGMEDIAKEKLIAENIYNFYKEQFPEVRDYLEITVVCLGQTKMIFYKDTDGQFILEKKYIKYYSDGSAEA